MSGPGLAKNIQEGSEEENKPEPCLSKERARKKDRGRIRELN